MQISVKKLTDLDLLQAACASTLKPTQSSSAKLQTLYRSGHSPARTQMFWINMDGIPSFVSVHYARHKIGVEHYVESNRDDRGGTTSVHRLTPVRHSMLANAQALINIAAERLCFKSHHTTVGVCNRLRSAVAKVDLELSAEMLPKCVVRGYCPEATECRAGVLAILRANHMAYPVQQRRKLAAALYT